MEGYEQFQFEMVGRACKDPAPYVEGLVQQAVLYIILNAIEETPWWKFLPAAGTNWAWSLAEFSPIELKRCADLCCI